MKKILVAVDGSAVSKRALARSADIARGNGAEVVLLYVHKLVEPYFSDPEIEEIKKEFEKSPMREGLEKRAMSVLKEAREYLENSSIKKVKTVFRWGHPVEEILKLAEKEKADLIVLGSRGERRGILMGSVSREVAERAKVSVLIGR